jgi:hypothetical protein
MRDCHCHTIGRGGQDTRVRTTPLHQAKRLRHSLQMRPGIPEI